MPRHSTLQELLLAIAITCMFALPGCKRTSESSDSTMDSEQHDKGIGIESDKSEAKTAVAQISASVPCPRIFRATCSCLNRVRSAVRSTWTA